MASREMKPVQKAAAIRLLAAWNNLKANDPSLPSREGMSIDLGWSNTDYSILVFAFLLGWAIGEVPIGMFMDRIGPRKGLGIIVFCWSVIMVFHSVARSIFVFTGLRFVLGFGECGNWSGGLKVISQWFPARERARAAGIFNGSINIGAIIAPPLTVWITR